MADKDLTAMLTDYQIDQMLRNDLDLQERLMIDIGKFTVALLGLDKNVEAKKSLAGTGTLVTLGGRHHILTASHVWHDFLKTSSRIGITLPANITHSFRMETSSIEPVADLRPSTGGSNGDLQVFCSPESGEVDWTRQLKGVAFWQKSLAGAIRTIRLSWPAIA
jgi:hypothetical protein